MLFIEGAVLGSVGRGKGGGDEASDAERKPQSGRRIIEASFWASPPRHPSIEEPLMMIVMMKMMKIMKMMKMMLLMGV